MAKPRYPGSWAALDAVVQAADQAMDEGWDPEDPLLGALALAAYEVAKSFGRAGEPTLVDYATGREAGGALLSQEVAVIREVAKFLRAL